MTNTTKAQKAAEAQAIEDLRKVLKPGDTVYTSVSHVSPSGMSRWISVYIVDPTDHEISDISWLTAKAVGWSVNTRNHAGVEVAGCGMDMGFHLVYTLSATLFPEGFDCIDTEGAERDYRHGCPSNDHVNYRASRGEIVPRHHDSGEYALRRRWL